MDGRCLILAIRDDRKETRSADMDVCFLTLRSGMIAKTRNGAAMDGGCSICAIGKVAKGHGV
jgi:hypothetical protein